MLKRIAVGCVFFFLLAQLANADPIIARLTMSAFDFGPNAKQLARLESFVTLEEAPGPFWLPWYQAYIPGPGYLITSLDGTLHTSFNGVEKDELAALAPIDPLRPWWVFNGGQYLIVMNVGWTTPSGFGSASFEITRWAVYISGQVCCFDGGAGAQIIPEPSSAVMLAIGLLALTAGITRLELGHSRRP